MTSMMKVSAHLADDKEVRVTIKSQSCSPEVITLQNGETVERAFYDDVVISAKEVEKKGIAEDPELPVGIAPLGSFSWALMRLREGAKVARNGWNGKGIFIKLQIPDENSKMTSPYIYIDTTQLHTENPTAPKCCVPWLASQTDMLSHDWEEVA